MSYEAVTDSRTSFGYAMYATDRPAYEPAVVARLEVEHDDRYMLRYTAGLGQPESPEMILTFFDFTPASYHPGLPYPSDAALVLDLSDIAAAFDSLVGNPVFMSVRDLDDMDDRSGTLECLWLEDTTSGLYAISPSSPVPIPEEGETVSATVEVNYTLAPPEDLFAELDSLLGVVELTWSPPTEAGLLLGYYVYRNGIRIDSTLSTAYSEHLVGAGTHSYAVSARHPTGESFQVLETVFGGENAYGLPYADDFETGLGGWYQAGNCGVDATITDEAVHGGEYAVSMKTVGSGNTFLIRPADAAPGIALQTWFNVAVSPEFEDAFSAGVGWLNQGGGMSGVFVAPDGTCSYTYPDAGDQEAITLDSTFVVQLETWYQQRLRYFDGLLHVTTLDTSWNVLLNHAVSIPAQDAVGILVGAGALEDGVSYFDDLVAGDWLGSGVNHFYPPVPGAEPYAVVVTEAATGDVTLEPGDEIGVFDGSRCVGSAVVEESWPLLLHAWAVTDSTHGYVDGNPILFRIWLSAEDRFYVGDPTFEQGGAFGDGLFSRVRLEAGVEVAADQMVRVEPMVYSLTPPTPNPFSRAATLALTLPETMRVRIAAYDMGGREIAVLAAGTHERGTHLLKLDGDRFSDGVYVIRAQNSQDLVTVHKVVVIH
jgi:hypothetical protein